MIAWILYISPYLLAAVRFLLAIVFLQSSVEKIREPDIFVKTVAAYRLLPKFVIRPFGFSLPWLELMLGLVLLSGWQTRLAAILTGMLYLLFIGALGINLLRGQTNMNCGCFGSKRRHKIDVGLILRDIGLLIASGLVTVFGGGVFAFETLTEGEQNLVIHGMGEIALPIIFDSDRFIDRLFIIPPNPAIGGIITKGGYSMNGFWLVSFVVLWIVVVMLALIILAMAKEIEALHTKINSLSRILGGTNFGITTEKHFQTHVKRRLTE